jgi:hypothetical protein
LCEAFGVASGAGMIVNSGRVDLGTIVIGTLVGEGAFGVASGAGMIVDSGRVDSGTIVIGTLVGEGVDTSTGTCSGRLVASY